ncbi:unnamed protein product, partial [Rotaria magnacalcarata]
IDFALKSIKVGDDIAPSNSTLDDLFDKTFIPHDLTKTCIIQVHVELKGVDDNKNVSNVKMKDYRAH